MQCPNCRQENAEGSLNCSRCQTPLKAQQGVVCPSCHQQNPVGMLFCGKCGMRFEQKRQQPDIGLLPTQLQVTMAGSTEVGAPLDPQGAGTIVQAPLTDYMGSVGHGQASGGVAPMRYSPGTGAMPRPPAEVMSHGAAMGGSWVAPAGMTPPNQPRGEGVKGNKGLLLVVGGVVALMAFSGLVVVFLFLGLLVWADDETEEATAVSNMSHSQQEQQKVRQGRVAARADKPGEQYGFDLEYVRIEAGSFMMGSPKAEQVRIAKERSSSRETLHHVTLTRPFEMSVTEVTQGQYEQMMGENPSSFHDCGLNCPVENVSWHDAVRFCNKLSKAEGLPTCYDCVRSECEAKMGDDIYDCEGYRLPTEAEWEYAVRAGTRTPYYSGGLEGDGTAAEPAMDQIGWYSDNTGTTTFEVKGKAPNAWGLYDMNGNVWEWCHEFYEHDWGTTSVTDPSGPSEGSERVARGGSWLGAAWNCRSATRKNYVPSWRYKDLGFRIVRSL